MLDKNFPTDEKLFIKTLLGEKSDHPPIWFMRQAGRYLPEYKKVRATTNNFLEFCYNPEKASKVTLQPIERFNFDAAIVFSDILVIPDALGQQVSFVQNEGPKLGELNIVNLSFNENHLSPVYEAIKITRSKLSPDKALIGFAGAPWTLATYMIEGGGSKDYLKTKSFTYQNENAFNQLIEILTDSVATHLINQIRSGADALQIFDSWAGALTPEQFELYCITPTKKIVDKIKSQYPQTPIIGFPRGVGGLYKNYAEKTGVTAISFDQNMPCDWIAQNINIPVQGNLDPVLLMNDKQKAVEQTKKIIKTFKNKPFIFNLGHGILQHTPIENVEAVVRAVKGV